MAMPPYFVQAQVEKAENGYVIRFQGKTIIANNEEELATQLLEQINPTMNHVVSVQISEKVVISPGPVLAKL